MDKMKFKIPASSSGGSEAMLRHYQQLVEAAGDVIYTCDYRGFCTYVNHSVKHLFGYDPEEVVGRLFTDFIHPDYRDDVYAYYVRQFQKRERKSVHEFPALTRDGEVKWVEQIVILQTEGDLVTGWAGFVREITQRKETEEQLRQSENTLRAIIDAVPDHIYVKDRSHRFTLVNHATWHNEGYDGPDDMLNLTDFDLYGPDGKEDWDAEEKLFQSGEPILNEERENPKPPEPGQREVVLINKVPLYDGEGKIIGLIGINRDITARKRTEEQLQQNMNTLKAMFEASIDLIFIKDRSLRYTLFNPAGVRMMGRPLEDIIGKTDYDLFGDDVGDQMGEIDRHVLATGESTSYEIERPLAEGNRWLLITKYPLLSAQGNVLGIVGTGHDITERKQAEADLQASEANLSALMNNTSDTIFSVDTERRLITYNANFEKRFLDNFGIQLRPGMKMEDHVPPKMHDDWVPWFNRALAGERFSVEYRYRSNGVVGYTDVNFNPIMTPDGKITGVAVFNRDITARKQAEADLQASEANLSALMNNTQDSIFSGDRDTRILTLNATFKQRYKLLFGIDIDVGTRLADTVTLEMAEQWLPYYERALAGESVSVEQRLATEDKEFFFDVTFNPIVSGDTVSGVAVFSRDISARVVAGRALRESEQRYRAVVEHQIDLLSRSQPDTTLTFVNDAYCRFFGKKREELLGQSHLILSPESEHAAFLERFETWLKHPGVYTHEHRHIRPNGEVHWIEWTDHAILNDEGEVIEIQSAGRDVTPRRLAEAALLESEQRYRAVVETQTELVSRSAPDTTLTFVNETYCRYFGKSRDELIGHSFLTLLPEEWQPSIRERYAEMVKERSGYTIEEQVIDTNGEVRWQEWTNRVILDDENKVVEVQSTGRDITERKRAEAERNQYIHHLEILQGLDEELSRTLKLDYVLEVALESAIQISGANAGAIHLLEDDGRIRVAQVIGDYPRTMVGSIMPPGKGIIARVARTQRAELVANVNEDPDYLPNVLATHAQITIPLMAQERLIGTLNVQTPQPGRFTTAIFDFLKLLSSRIATALDNARLHDSLQKHYDDLQTIHQQVSQLEQLKSLIIRIAAHDLRNPLGVISGYLQMIEIDQDLHLPERTVEQLRIITDSADRIDKISRDILTLDRVQRGIVTETVDLAEMVRTNYVEHVPQAGLKKLDFQLEPVPKSLLIQGDSVLLRETVSNLISNAIKYTLDGGRVTVRLMVEGEQVIFEVEDTGYGIPEEQQANLFNPFFRVKLTETRDIKGTGLGLNLVKNIVERHEGTIRFHSVYQQGSTFGFQLPLPPSAKRKKGKGKNGT